VAAEQIRFYGEGVNSRIELIERSLTGALDKLDILKAEIEELGTWWEGEAYLQWKSTAACQMAGVEAGVRGMNAVVGAVAELADKLWETEKKNKELTGQI